MDPQRLVARLPARTQRQLEGRTATVLADNADGTIDIDLAGATLTVPTVTVAAVGEAVTLVVWDGNLVALAAPTRVMLDVHMFEATMFLDLPGVNGHAASNYTTAATGEITATARILATDYTPAVINTILSQYLSDANGNFIFRLVTTGELGLYRVIGGASAGALLSTVTLASVGCVDATTKVWVRVHHIASTGVTTFWYSFTDTNVEADVVWTQLGATVAASAGVRDASTYAHKVGIHATTGNDFIGHIYSASLRAGDPSAALVYNPRFYALPWLVGDHATDAHTDDQGVTWTLVSDAKVAAEDTAFAFSKASADGFASWEVEVVGGGGGGGGSPTTAAGEGGAGGGGGGGGYSKAFGQVADLPVSVPIVVGGSGLGGLGSANNETTGRGGTSYFGGYAQATGGRGGGGSPASATFAIRIGGSVGVGTLGYLNVTGQPGSHGLIAAGGDPSRGGQGGHSLLGGGGRTPGIGEDGRSPLGGYGGGASGASNGSADANVRTGGWGSPGVVIVRLYGA